MTTEAAILMGIGCGFGPGLIAGAILGAWLYHRGMNAATGSGKPFVGSPKGEVFAIFDETDKPLEDGPSMAEKRIVERSKRFSEVFGK